MSSHRGYAALCYHYLRPDNDTGPFAKLLGTGVREFRNHLDLFRKRYWVIAPEDARAFSDEGYRLPRGRQGLLLTFDDGLSDHYRAARILAEADIRAFFFIPTCVLDDREPANPIIVHYGLARYRIAGFLRAYRHAIEAAGLSVSEYDIPYRRGSDDPWKTIAAIKSTFKYRLRYAESRKILLHIHRNLLLKDHPDALEIMHLTPPQVREMLQMGHSLGAHTRSHISVAASELTAKEFSREIIEPRQSLEQTFDTRVDAFSYPFGDKQDCLSSEQLIGRTREYKLAFTVEKILNTRKTDPLQLGRYMPMSTDDAPRLGHIIATIIQGKGDPL